MKQSSHEKLHSRRRVLLAALAAAGVVYAAPALLGLNAAQAHSRYTRPSRPTRPSRYTRPTRFTRPTRYTRPSYHGRYGRGDYHPGPGWHGPQGGWQPR